MVFAPSILGKMYFEAVLERAEENISNKENT
jgi:hypothetical protein